MPLRCASIFLSGCSPFHIYICCHFQRYFREKCAYEEGYILFVRENALQILLPKFGMECTLYVKDKPGTAQPRVTIPFTYDEERCTQAAKGVVLRQFERVTVRVSLDRSNIQHQKVVVDLVDPFVSII